MVSVDQAFAAAFEHHRAGRVRAAEPLYLDVVQRDPQRHEALAYLGLIALDESRDQAAVGYFKRATEIAPSVADYHLNLYSGAVLPEILLDSATRRGDLVREVGAFKDDDLVRLVREDEVDVLVDLTMHMSGTRLTALAKRAAPVQIAWLAYPGTTGVPAMDYRLTDPYLDARENSELPYSEQSIWLAEAFWPYALPEGDLDCGGLPALRNGHVTFGSFNAFSKVHDGLLDLWARVLLRVGDSRLLLLAPDGRSRTHAVRRLASHGVAADRIEFVDRQPQRQYLETYGRIDVALDTFPTNGHTTSLDSFFMGVPVVTLTGDRVVGRAGSCIAQNLELPELVASTPDDYVEIAARLCADLHRLDTLRGALRGRMQRSVFMDGERFVRQLERAYREAIARTHARGA